jgi:hypothetical protein
MTPTTSIETIQTTGQAPDTGPRVGVRMTPFHLTTSGSGSGRPGLDPTLERREELRGEGTVEHAVVP